MVEGEAIEPDEAAYEGELTDVSAAVLPETGDEVCAVSGADEVASSCAAEVVSSAAGVVSSAAGVVSGAAVGVSGAGTTALEVVATAPPEPGVVARPHLVPAAPSVLP